MSDQLLNIVARSRNGILFEGNAYSITSFNSKGKFDVLPMHANFISLIGNTVEIRAEDKIHVINLSRGMIYVLANDVKIFVDI